ncbi:probable cytochrome P450 313a4 [Musca domestica]|uniref:Probable cytochrome P450 313a4 n=1 Tax=Musca domestica TaxID=7370 RepID=A0A1I8NDF6_MUSDO|nr:probable cytochrome P450 313a4 [Musca domestica]
MSYWTIFVVLCVWFYWLWTRRRYYALIFKISGPLGYPLLGKTLDLIDKNKDPLSVIHTHSEKYGPLMYTWLVTYPVLLVTDPDIIRDVFTSPHCTNKSVLYKAVTNGVGRGLFSSDDPEWGVHRKHLNPAFGHKILLSFMPIFNQEVNKVLKLFKEMGECSDVVALLQDLTLKIAIRTTMGVNADQEYGNGHNGNLIKSYQCVVENMTDILFAPWLTNNLIRRVLGVYEPFNSCKAENRNFIRKLIANKLNGNGSDGKNADGSKNIFIDQAIELLRKNLFTQQHVEDESNTIVLGAFETTANTIGYVLILLAMFPEYQQKAYEELVSIFPEGGDFDVTYANIQDMIYMDMVLNESMRIMTPVPFVGRENVKDIQLSNGMVIPAGVQFVINIFTMHRRKDIWGAAADDFNPDNFLPSNMEGKHPYAFIPFTKGIRNCIGWKYGLMSAKVALAKLLRNFQFSTDFQYNDLEFYDSIVLKLKQMPVLRITRR